MATNWSEVSLDVNMTNHFQVSRKIFRDPQNKYKDQTVLKDMWEWPLRMGGHKCQWIKGRFCVGMMAVK